MNSVIFRFFFYFSA
ncbi:MULTISPECIES: pheST operon leader peptide PheM [Serratia]|nr:MULTISPECIES: pheST operon leader peptide PheM [Serratia]MBV6694462.1 pheST operon leader peptide PheM [Serratia quinivorans]